MEIDSAVRGGAGPHAELLEELSTLTLEQIRRRRAQLRVTHAGLQVQLVELASGSCAAFVESAACACEVNERLRRIGGHLKMLEGSLPRVGTEACALQARTGASIEKRGRNARLLERHAEVLEALEQPQMMDTCVRNSFVDEALDLEAAARAKALLHASVPLVQSLSAEVGESMGAQRAALLAQLAGPLLLPDALRCVGYLRRMGAQHALSETQLRVAFLRNRTLHFAHAEALLPRESAAGYLLKWMELCRTHWYDTLTLYRTCFNTAAAASPPHDPRDPAARATAPPSFRSVSSRWPQGAAAGNAVALVDPCGAAYILRVPAGVAGDDVADADDVELLAETTWGEAALERPPAQMARSAKLGASTAGLWALERVRLFVLTLEQWLPAIHDGALLAHVSEQAASCGASLVRLGLDFGALCVSPFRAAVWRLLDDGLAAALQHWHEALAAHRWHAQLPSVTAVAQAAEPPADVAATANAAPAAECGGGGGSVEEARGAALTPPTALLAHPPVGTLCNHLLMVLNELRQCAAYGLRPLLFDRLSVALVAAVAALRELPARAAFTDGAHEQFRALCMCFADNLVPHVGGCADILIPPWVSPTFPAPESNDCRTDRLIATVRAEVEPLLRQEEAP